MGADSTIVFYGVRFATNEDESEGLELNTDPRIRVAHEHQLAHWWGSFAVDAENEQYILLIGAIIAQIGHEADNDVCVRDEDYQSIVNRTKSRLSLAGFADEPALHILFEPDY